MKKELELLLAEYLGELLHEQENTFDWNIEILRSKYQLSHISNTEKK